MRVVRGQREGCKSLKSESFSSNFKHFNFHILKLSNSRNESHDCIHLFCFGHWSDVCLESNSHISLPPNKASHQPNEHNEESALSVDE